MIHAPEGYTISHVLSPGPASIVAVGRAPDGQACIVKTAAIARAADGIRREGEILRALGEAQVEGVPRLLAVAQGEVPSIALERLALRRFYSFSSVMAGARASAGADDAAPAWRARAACALFERLAAIHDAGDAAGPLGVVHGDLSPYNAYIADDASRAAIADFDLARWRGGGPPVDGAFRGTLHYAAPEVARGEAPTARADDFALAASILHVATGVTLRDAQGAMPALLAEAAERPFDAAHPWTALTPKLFPRAIADALLACLAFEPRDRPPKTPRPVLERQT